MLALGIVRPWAYSSGELWSGWKPDVGGPGSLWEVRDEAWLSPASEGYYLGLGVPPPQASALWCSPLHSHLRQVWCPQSANHPLASLACPAPTQPVSPALPPPQKRKCSGPPSLVLLGARGEFPHRGPPQRLTYPIY